jgi:ATP:corrinoid adenosyltransferase
MTADTDKPELTEDELNARHAEKMRKKKAARDKIMATKTIEKGLVIVHTGKGKGKSTAGFGMVFRSLGHGHKVGVVQFVKGRIETGERMALERFSRSGDHQAHGRGIHLGNPGPPAGHRRGSTGLGRCQGHDPLRRLPADPV